MIRPVLMPLMGFLVFVSCMRAEINQTRAMVINDVAISKVPNGSYTGSFEYGGFTYSVRCVVRDGRLEKIKVLQNRTTKYAKMAEGVISRIVEQQQVNVDAISGATSTSKALMKATEKALLKGIEKTQG